MADKTLNLPGEVWKDVNVLGADYVEASSLGRLRAKARMISFSRNGKSTTYHRPSQILHQHSCSRGYRYTNIQINKVSKTFLVHPIICEAFHGPKPEGRECAHCNGIRSDNTKDNLAWKTHAENEADKVAHGTRAFGQRHHNASISDDVARDVRAKLDAGLGPIVVSKQTGVSIHIVQKMNAGTTWKHLLPQP